jgi:hypothetical protein
LYLPPYLTTLQGERKYLTDVKTGKGGNTESWVVVCSQHFFPSFNNLSPATHSKDRVHGNKWHEKESRFKNGDAHQAKSGVSGLRLTAFGRFLSGRVSAHSARAHG